MLYMHKCSRGLTIRCPVYRRSVQDSTCLACSMTDKIQSAMNERDAGHKALHCYYGKKQLQVCSHKWILVTLTFKTRAS